MSLRAASRQGGWVSTEDIDLVQDRLRNYLKTLFIIACAFHLVNIVVWALVWRALDDDYPPSLKWIGFGITIAIGVGWWVAGNRSMGARWVVGCDVGLTLLSLVKTSLILFHPHVDVSYALLGVGFKLSLRAALVPSPATRTLLVGVVGMGMLAGSLTLSGRPQSVMIVWFYVLGAAFVAVTVVSSRVIYGLRRDVRQARRLGQYELKRKIGEGGMGVVYEATHVLLKRPTALKLLPVDRVGELAVARFEREVRHTSELEHPNSIYIYDYGHTPDGQFYYAMEYIDGLNLEELIAREGQLGSPRVRAILLQVAYALAEAHAKALVHRDIKPANIMICERGGVPDTVKVLDFGLVKNIKGDDEVALTQAHAVMGTLHYMAPEMVAGDEVGPPADVYAVGAVGYYLLTGQTLFSGRSVSEICAKHMNAEPVVPSEISKTAVDPELEALIMRMLAKSPSDRYPNGTELAEALKRLSTPTWSMDEARCWWQSFQRATPSNSTDTVDTTQLAIELHGRDPEA